MNGSPSRRCRPHLFHRRPCLRLAPVLLDDGQSFVLVELLLVGLVLHAAQSGRKVLELDLAVDFLILTDPTSMPFELLPNGSPLPVSFFENPQESVKMNLFHEGLVPLNWVGYLAAECAVSDRPIENSILE